MPKSLDAELGLSPEQSRLLRTPAAFRLAYRDDPVAFAHDCIDGESLADYQEEILSNLISGDRVAVRAPHGAGKSALASIALWWFALTRDEEGWKIPTTASAWAQLERFFWPEVHLWSRRIRWDKVGHPIPEGLLTLDLKLRNGQAFAIASDEPGRMEGAHAAHVLAIFDESKIIPDKTWDALEGAFSTGGLNGGEARALAISTPGPPAGRFYDIHTKRDRFPSWWVRHVTLDEAIKAGRIDPAWVEERRREWGEDSVQFQNRVLAEFVSIDDSVVFRRIDESSVLPQFYEPMQGMDYTLGVDLAKYADYTVMVVMDRERRVVYAERFNGVAWSLQRERIQTVAQKYSARVIPDATGVGDPIVEDLQRMGLGVDPYRITTGEKRTQLIEHLANEMDKGQIQLPVLGLLPALQDELRGFRYTTTKTGKLYMGPAGDSEHDDCVFALALAAWGWKNRTVTRQTFVMPQVKTLYKPFARG